MSNHTNLRQQTIDTYNSSAEALAEYFSGIGPRVKYIDTALRLAGEPEAPRVLEIGCGDGRDATEITKKAGWYQGFDISKELIRIARARLPEADFVVADAVDFIYPNDLDVVFAFASLLHLNKDEFKSVLEKVHKALKPAGIFYISLKYRDEYSSEVKKDQYGERLFYFYNGDVVRQLAEEAYEVVAEEIETIGHTKWLEIALKKR